MGNLKLSFSERSYDVKKGFLFKPGVIWQTCLPRTNIQLKIIHCETWNVRLSKQRWENVSFPKRPCKILKGFLIQFRVV